MLWRRYITQKKIIRETKRGQKTNEASGSGRVTARSLYGHTKNGLIGIYIHIPFCHRKCHYCSFISETATQDHAAYFAALYSEIIKRANELSDFSYIVRSIYIGGGTPSVMPAQALTKIITLIRQWFNVDVLTEITVEANPESLTTVWIKELLLVGVNRISVGVQSFSDDLLQQIGRGHTATQAKQAIAILKHYGVANVGIDLLYGLPQQTMTAWQQTVKMAIIQRVQHISMYSLKVEENSLWGSEKIAAGDDDLAADMWQWATEYLNHANYERYEISNFSLQGYRSIHNNNYWNFGEYLGLGVAAHSFINKKRLVNSNNIVDYISDNYTSRKEIACTDQDLMFEYVFLRLRTIDGLDEFEFMQYWHCQLPENYIVALQQGQRDGLLHCDSGCWRLTNNGVMLSNQIFCNMLD